MEKILIIGGVAAGATAAAKARRLSPNAEITMLEAGPDISFANCGLPYYIGGDIKNRSKLILQSPESFKDQYNVTVHTHTMVTEIDRKQLNIKTINTRSGKTKTYNYTKLILAQGGRPIKPDINGADSEHVFTLWTLEDMDKITHFINENKPKTAVVVGGGFIGLEMAEALVKQQLQVSLVEMMPHVMSIMDGEIAGFIENEMLSYGINLNTSTSVIQIDDNTVTLDNGKQIKADMVLLSIGVRPTLQLAKDSGLSIGEAGGLLVNKHLQTSDPNIYAAGDMVEVENRISGKKVRIPLAGPANRQGRIVAENALGGQHTYKGAIGTSIVRVFDAVAGITGLSLKQALNTGVDAEAIVVHKEHHTSYYPGAKTVSVMLIYDKKTGQILGGQTCGYKGADRRLDVIATTVSNKLKISDLADIDFAYSPPLGTANDVINMAAYVAENKLSNYSPSVTSSELDNFIENNNSITIIDVRDLFSFKKSHIKGAIHIPLELLYNKLSSIPKDKNILIYDETGKKGHQALRILKGGNFKNITNISGGHTSVQRYQRAIGFKNIDIELLPIKHKSINEESIDDSISSKLEKQKIAEDFNSPIVVDVRTPEEFITGAYPNAINLPLDELTYKFEDVFGTNKKRDIVVYCASGARSAYAQQFLTQNGYTNVKNGGGLMHMMMNNQ